MTNDTVLNEDLRKYELMVIINPDIGEDAIKKRLDKVRKQIADAKGEVVFEEMWALRELAYPIKKHEKGFYVVLDFMYEPKKIKELEATLRLEPEVLRHLVTVLPTTYEPKDYVAEAEKAAAEEAKEEALNPSKKPRRKPAMKEEKAPMKEMKAESPKMEEEGSKKTSKKKEEKKQTLEDVDAKLKSIIENPDINF